MRPIYIDHGTPIGSTVSEPWALARWRGFRNVFAAKGIEVAHLPIGGPAGAWDDTLKVQSTAQRELLNSTLLNSSECSIRQSGTVEIALRYDGILCSGTFALHQVAHALDRWGCWMPHAVCGGIIVGTVDFDPVAQQLLQEEKVSVVVHQRQFLQIYLSVALAVLSARSPAVLPNSSIAIDTTSLFDNASVFMDADSDHLCDALCLLANMNITDLGQRQQKCSVTNFTMEIQELGSDETRGLPPDGPLSVCQHPSMRTLGLVKSQLQCARDAGIIFCPRHVSARFLESARGAGTRNSDGITTANVVIMGIVGFTTGLLLAMLALLVVFWMPQRRALASLAVALGEDTRSTKLLQECIDRCEDVRVSQKNKQLMLANLKLRSLERRYLDRDALLEAIEFGGTSLIKGSWLVANCSRFPRQQELPEDAQWYAQELQSVIHSVEIVAISYSWLHPVHPDPTGQHLHTLKKAITERLAFKGPAHVFDIAIFLDYMSLPQMKETGPLANPEIGMVRTESESMAFEKALRDINLWYAHQHTTVWMLRWTPPGHPKYMDRGWPFFEQATSCMIKDCTRIFEIKPDNIGFPDWMRSTRSPPIIPDDFEKLLEEKVFTNRADPGVVANTYKEAFEEVVGRAKVLMFSGFGWGDAEARELAKALPLCRQLEHLVVSNNEITVRGANDLVQACSKCESLRCLDFRDNKIPEGMEQMLLNQLKLLRAGAAAEQNGLQKIVVRFSNLARHTARVVPTHVAEGGR